MVFTSILDWWFRGSVSKQTHFVQSGIVLPITNSNIFWNTVLAFVYRLFVSNFRAEVSKGRHEHL